MLTTLNNQRLKMEEIKKRGCVTTAHPLHF